MPTQVIDGARQQAALDALLATLEPEALALRPELVALIPPRPPLSGASRELFPRETGYLFDPIAAAATSAELTFRMLLNPTRAARLNQQAMFDSTLPAFGSVLDLMLNRLFDDSMRLSGGAEGDGKNYTQMLISQRIQSDALTHLLALAGHTAASPQVRADAWGAVVEMGDRIAQYLTSLDKERAVARERSWRVHYLMLGQRIAAAAEGSGGWPHESITVPPGSPI